MMLIIGILVAVVILLYLLLVKPLSYWNEKGVKQESILRALSFNWFSIFGRQSVALYVKNMYDQFPNERYSGIYQMNAPVLVIRDPELMKLILVKNFDHFTDRRTYVPEDMDPLWAKNLFALKGSKWRNMRSTLSPAFTSSKMKRMFILIKDCAESLVEHFSKQNQEIISLDMKDTCTRFCNDVIATTAFGVKVDSLADPNNEFFLMGMKATNLNTLKKTFQFLGYLLAPKVYRLFNLKFFDHDVSSFFRKLIDETVEAREKRGIVRPDMIHLLMEARSGIVKEEEISVEETGYASVQESVEGDTMTNITNEDITAQALVFFFAGFESLSSVMCFMAYELAVNQDIQEKLRMEISESFEKCGGELTYAVLVNMKYLDMVVSEVLRKWPTQTAAERVCSEAYTIIPTTPEEQPLHLEKGSIIVFPQFGIHRDPKYFPDPERFDPERFNDENKSNIVPFSYQPFGQGPRNCIGSRFALLEMKVLFFYLLLNFEIVPIERTRIPLVLSKSSILVSVEGGFWMGLKHIEK